MYLSDNTILSYLLLQLLRRIHAVPSPVKSDNSLLSDPSKHSESTLQQVCQETAGNLHLLGPQILFNPKTGQHE